MCASIGNSDDKLSQADWSVFIEEFRTAMRRYAEQVYGNWLSEPSDRYQNACMAIEVSPGSIGALKMDLGEVRKAYSQDSVAFVVAERTEFI